MDKPTPITPLAEWLESAYIIPKKTKCNCRWRLRRSVRLLSQCLERPATVADLKPDLLPTFEVWLSQNYPGHAAKEAAEQFRTLCRHVGTMRKPCNPKGRVFNPDANGNAITLSEAEGTLWHICQTLYFPVAIRITSGRTRQHYFQAIKWFKLFLGHDATIADLTNDNCTGMLKLMRDKGRAPETANNTVGRIKTLWEFLAKRRLIDEWPTFQGVKEPKRIPKAWSRDEMDRLIEACSKVQGRVGSVKASDWWTCLILLLWDTSERIGAAIAIRKDWLNWDTGDLSIPAECRKGQESDAVYKLHPETVAALARIRDNGSKLLFGEPCNPATLYDRYKKIRKAAGLSLDSKSAFHRIRRSVASHLHAAGHNATDALGHQSAEVTRKSYLDPLITGKVRPADVLFRPGKRDDDSNGIAVIALYLSPGDARKLPRAKLLKGGAA